MSHHLRFLFLAGLRLGGRLILCHGLRFSGRLILHYGLRLSRGLVLYHRLRLRLMLHNRLGLRSGLVLHHYRLGLRGWHVLHYYRLGLRSRHVLHYHRLIRLISNAASIVAQTQGKVIAAAESHYYHAGHQDHFKHILFHNVEDRGVCLYKNEAHQQTTFI